MRTTTRGFTLIELLVVIAIIGILSSVVLASLNSARSKGRDARRISDLKQLQLALELYYDANSQTYPAGTAYATALAALSPNYISTLPLDPVNSGTNVYSYNGITSAGASCGTTPCSSYVLRAALENAVPAGDVDGAPITGFDCDDATNRYYCVRP